MTAGTFLTLHHPRAAREFYAAGTWRNDTLYSLLQGHARATPNLVAARDCRRKATWAELLGAVDAVAFGLRSRGLVRGDRVSVWMSNRMEAIIVLLACSREGFACNPSLHRAYTCAETASLLERLGSAALVSEHGWGIDRADSDFDAMLTALPFLKVHWEADEMPWTGGSGPEPEADADKVVYLAFTSGTTGSPKCVMHSDNTLLANARDLVADWGHDASTRLLTLSPLSHHIAWVAVAQWLLTGCLLITAPPKSTAPLDWIAENGATYVMGVPTHAIDLLAEQATRQADLLKSVRVFYMAGAPIPPSVAEAFAARGIKPQNVYGMTENSSHQYTLPTDPPVVSSSTCGRGGRAYQVKLFDLADSDLLAAPGTAGQIGGRGAALMLGYYANQDATAASFNADGWFMSGDVGTLDDEGNLRIDGRVKDLIIRGGHNIYPAHIEALALRHHGIGKAAAIPVADSRLGERVCLVFSGSVASGEIVPHLLAAGLSKADLPEFLVRVDEFPLTPSGKILKRELVRQLLAGQLRADPVAAISGSTA